MYGKLHASLLLLAAAGGTLLFWPMTVLEFANSDRGTVARYPLGRGDSFSVTYLHSIYLQPVTEEFAAGSGGELVLTGVRSNSGAVLEYFGFTDSLPYHAMNRPMRAIVFRVAMGEAQVLTLAGQEIPFLSMGDHGDRIAVRLAREFPAARGIGWVQRKVLGR